MKLSNRLMEMEASPIRKLTPYTDEAKARSINVIPLNIGQPDTETPQEFFYAVKEFDDKVLRYEDSRGDERLIRTIVDYYKKFEIDFSEEEIIITNGASEGVIFALATVCDYGDEVLAPEPYYSNYNNFADLLDVKIVPVTTYAENGFALPEIELFEQAITSRTKAIMISNPGNPTGRVYTKEEIELLRKLALKYDLFILADEVYKEFIYNGDAFISLADYDDLSQHVILLDSISKRYSCCGARIGTIASKNKDVMANILKLAQSRLCVSTLDQVGAARLSEVNDKYIEDVVAEYKKRRDLIFQRIVAMDGVVAQKPNGAFYFLMKLPVDDAEKFTIWILENVAIDNETILLTPAESFYQTDGLGRNEVRISYCISLDKLEKAMDILELALKQYPGKTI